MEKQLSSIQRQIQEKLPVDLPLPGTIPPIEQLNALFEPLSYLERLHLLYAYFEEGEVLVTSSFGTRSVLLLWALSQMQPRQRVHFIDTGYHFPETLQYLQQLRESLNLRLVEVHPDAAAHDRTNDEQWWLQHPDACCAINKVEPLEAIKGPYKVWISGLMQDQTQFRAGLQVFEQQGDLLKFHPMLNLDEGMFRYETGRLKLPMHPLEALGYGSVGCSHCTKQGAGRSGRWQGQEKTECGLHPGYFDKK